jgi:hypothetical protein
MNFNLHYHNVATLNETNTTRIKKFGIGKKNSNRARNACLPNQELRVTDSVTFTTMHHFIICVASLQFSLTLH